SDRAEWGSGPDRSRRDTETPAAATVSTRVIRSAMALSRLAETPAFSARRSRAVATTLSGSAPEGILRCGATQAPRSHASHAVLRTIVDFPRPASPRIVRPRSGMSEILRGRRTSRQSLSWAVRPAHTRGTESDPGLKGESIGFLI